MAVGYRTLYSQVGASAPNRALGSQADRAFYRVYTHERKAEFLINNDLGTQDYDGYELK